MGLPEELYCAMVEAGAVARRHNVPCSLARTMTDVAQKSIDLWKRDENAAVRFAAKVLCGPINLRATTGQLSSAKPVGG